MCCKTLNIPILALPKFTKVAGGKLQRVTFDVHARRQPNMTANIGVKTVVVEVDFVESIRTGSGVGGFSNFFFGH